MKKSFDYTRYPWKKNIDYRLHPEFYRIGKGEQGVLICQPYKSEILPFWQFRTSALALKSAKKIYRIFLNYIRSDDFIGADIARKYLQMGFTRSRRYANYKGGIKYTATGRNLKKGTGDPVKSISAKIFYSYWQRAESNKLYSKWKVSWKKLHG